VTGNHSRDEPNVQAQNVLDGTTSLTTSDRYYGTRSDSPTTTTFSSQDSGRDTIDQGSFTVFYDDCHRAEQSTTGDHFFSIPWSGDLPHDPTSRTRRSKTSSPTATAEVHFECRICLSEPTPTSDLTATHCGHLFCYESVDPHLPLLEDNGVLTRI
jgi:hypothetical protein